MMTLIDQSQPSLLRYTCSVCEATVQAPTLASAEKHKCAPDVLAAIAARATAPEPKPPRAKRTPKPPKAEPVAP